jgi:hypothetical protein
MTGHDLKVGLLVRVVLDRERSILAGRVGTVEQVGPKILGSMPMWAMVRFDGDDENVYRANVWDLEPA